MSGASETEPPLPGVTVVICSRERPALLLDTVRSVLAGARVPDELLVVDQSVEENTELLALGPVRGCDVRYVRTELTGLSRARNVGMRAARHDIVVLLDDDMFVEEDWLESLLSGLPADPRAVVTGRVLAAPPKRPGDAVPPAALVTSENPATYVGPQPRDVVPGANVAFHRQEVLELGGYDERLGAGTRFSAADDNDMGHRMLVAGFRVQHVPNAVVLHRAWRPRAERLLLRWRYGRGKGAFYAKHIGLGDRHMRRRAWADIRGRLGRASRSVLASPRSAAAELLSVAGNLSGAADWIIRERVLNRRRR